MEISDIVRANCEYLLDKNKITIYRLAKNMNLNYTTVYRLIKGTGTLTLKSIENLSIGLGVNTMDLMTPLPPEAPPKQKKI